MSGKEHSRKVIECDKSSELDRCFLKYHDCVTHLCRDSVITQSDGKFPGKHSQACLETERETQQCMIQMKCVCYRNFRTNLSQKCQGLSLLLSGIHSYPGQSETFQKNI